MASKEYVAIFIKPQTRKKLKVMCVKEEKSFDGMLLALMDK